MSVVAKKPLIKVVVNEGKSRRLYDVSEETAKKVSALIESVSADEELFPVEKFFPDLGDPLKGPGLSLHGTRLRLGLTQKEMAKKIGVSQGDLSKMEKGILQIGKKLAMRIGKALNTNYRKYL